MNAPGVNIQKIDGRRSDARESLSALREALSPRGNIVSAEGRRRTLEVFGRELTPQQVDTVCEAVRSIAADTVADAANV